MGTAEYSCIAKIYQKVILPVRSRCLLIKVELPTIEKLYDTLTKKAFKGVCSNVE